MDMVREQYRDQEVQTEKENVNRVNFTFQGGNSDEYRYKDSLELPFEKDPNLSSNSSLPPPASTGQSNITIINNKPDLRFLLDKAKGYE